MQKILLVLQQNGETISDVSVHLCINIRRCLSTSNIDIVAVLWGSCSEEALKSLGHYGVHTVHHVSGDDYYSPEQRVKVIIKLAESLRTSLIIMPNTLPSREIAPLLASELNGGILSNCYQLQNNNDKIEAIIDVYNEQYQSICELSGETGRETHVVLMKDVNPGKYSPTRTSEAEVIKDAVVVKVESMTGLEEGVIKATEVFDVPGTELDISEAEVVIGIGRGVQTQENFQMMRYLAGVVAAPLGGSRPAVDFGWLPFEKQIGQTGRIIAPELYLAVGISGAQQHISGVEKAKIISINSDPQAPILRVADLGVVGDIQEIVPLLIQKLQKLRKGVDEDDL